VCRETLPALAKTRGLIVNISISGAMQRYLHQSAYSASKHCFLGFARSLAIEAKSRGIHVHNLCPGGVDTGLLKGTFLGKRLEGQPMIKAEDIAEMVIFLLKQPTNIALSAIVVIRFNATA